MTQGAPFSGAPLKLFQNHAKISPRRIWGALRKSIVKGAQSQSAGLVGVSQQRGEPAYMQIMTSCKGYSEIDQSAFCVSMTLIVRPIRVNETKPSNFSAKSYFYRAKAHFLLTKAHFPLTISNFTSLRGNRRVCFL